MNDIITRAFAALGFLTVVPVPRRGGKTALQTAGCAAFFPLVGAIIGLVLAGLNWIFSLGLPPGLSAALLLTALALLTGGLHLDGLADTCDGLGGYRDVAERLRIMRDSRVGGYGVIGIVLLLLVKYVSLSSIPAGLMTVSLILMPVTGRWAMVYAVFAYPYARPDGLGADLKRGTGWVGFVTATVIAAVAAWLCLPLVGPGILLLVWLVTLVLAAVFKKAFTGLTGDNYGAINEVAEVAVLVLVVLAARLGIV